MKKKKILVDLSILKHLYCGVGQIALNYGNYFKNNSSLYADCELCLLMPRKMFGMFGNEVKYVASGWWKIYFPFLCDRYDVWHAIHQSSKFFPFHRNTKYLLTIHDLNFLYEKNNDKAQKYLRRLQKKADRADIITCISQFTKQDIKKHLNLNGKEIDVIYNGVNFFDINNRQKPGFVKNGKDFFFSIGEIKRKKNFHVLLPLMKLFPEKELYIAGKHSTSYTRMLCEIIEKEQLDNVHLPGTVSDKERTWLFANCEAFLFPSLFEGFGLPVIEAMSAGKPVFSSKETSLKEIGGERAFFWDDFAPGKMKEVIDKHLPLFYASPGNAEKNRTYAASFTYEKHMEAYRKIYTEELETE